MRRLTHCKLCGERLKENKLGEYVQWQVEYCCFTCYLTDKILPNCDSHIEECYSLPKMVINYRYKLIVRNESDPIYNEPFEEEEDMLVKNVGECDDI